MSKNDPPEIILPPSQIPSSEEVSAHLPTAIIAWQYAYQKEAQAMLENISSAFWETLALLGWTIPAVFVRLVVGIAKLWKNRDEWRELKWRMLKTEALKLPLWFIIADRPPKFAHSRIRNSTPSPWLAGMGVRGKGSVIETSCPAAAL